MTTSPDPRSWFLSLAATALVLSPVAAQSTTRVSLDSAGAQGVGASSYPSISADGRCVAFGSFAGLVSGDTNNAQDVFVHDRQTGQTSRVSVDSTGGQANGGSGYPSLSADGRFVTFQSSASNLVSGDTNNALDIFVHDRQTGQTSRVSVDSAGMQGNNKSETSSISADGLFVAFRSLASDLVPGDTNNTWDVFVHDRQTGHTSRVSVDSAGVQGSNSSNRPSISADGRLVAFDSTAGNLVPGDTNNTEDIFVHDRHTSRTSRVSVDSTGAQGNRESWNPSVSAAGRFVAFGSLATNLVPGDTNGWSDAFVHDRQTGQTRLVSVDSAGAQGNHESWTPSISADGRFVAFWSFSSNLVSGDTNNIWDVFVHDHQTGQTSRVSVSSAGVQGNRKCYSPSIFADGRYVAFVGEATNLVSGDTNSSDDIFVHDRGDVSVILSKSGACPGAVSLTIKQATPGGVVVLVYGSAGVFVKPGLPCQGLVLGISTPGVRRLLQADAAGKVEFMTNLSAAACGLTLQAADVTTCTASNTVVL